MRTILIVLIAFTVISCKAQQHIIGIYNNTTDYEENPNYYLKDVDNDFDKFLGTWKWESGTTSLIFQLDKEIKYQLDSNYNYQDMLVGEYQYIENGIEKVNTLTRLSDNSIEGYDHKIKGYSIISKVQTPKCDSCDISERRMGLMIEHQTAEDVMASMVLRYINDNGVEKLEAYIYGRGAPFLFKEDRTEPTEMDVPYGNYTLVKQ